MAQSLSHTSAPALTVIGGQPTTSSIDVARHFGKRHKTVLRAIANLDCSPEFTEHNCAPSEYTDATGRTLPAYQLTRDTPLPDGPKLAAERAGFVDEPAAQTPPHVFVGASLATVRFWHGKRRTDWARDWVRVQTDGAGVLAMTDGEELPVA